MFLYAIGFETDCIYLKTKNAARVGWELRLALILTKTGTQCR